MQQQRPIQTKGTTCPFHKVDVSKVCHKCELYVPVKLKNPQTEEVIDRWACAIAWGPALLLEAAQAAHQGTAATESFRNEVIRQATRTHQLERL